MTTNETNPIYSIDSKIVHAENKEKQDKTLDNKVIFANDVSPQSGNPNRQEDEQSDARSTWLLYSL